jgi:hypothetical protein
MIATRRVCSLVRWWIAGRAAASVRGSPSAKGEGRWRDQLSPRGFHLAERVLDFSGGKPGDVGLILFWGE